MKNLPILSIRGMFFSNFCLNWPEKCGMLRSFWERYLIYGCCRKDETTKLLVFVDLVLIEELTALESLRDDRAGIVVNAKRGCCGRDPLERKFANCL